MGLDCYVRVSKVDEASGKEEFTDIWYGRKENEIHGWMQRKSGIGAQDFNCHRFPLTLELMDQLENAEQCGQLTPTEGFFFGSGNPADEINRAVEELLIATRTAIACGKEPHYFSWF